ncbi:MAG: hypothetical protein R3293_08530 [Candidatus Promineifilaceae bacterium]|nr:hypothetical protein [Candidatus Promineifilaceae bacterium]
MEDYVRWELGSGPRRYYQNKPLDYRPPNESAFIRDIFFEDARHTWFVYFLYGSESPGIWRLDDGGMPADFSDDV